MAVVVPTVLRDLERANTARMKLFHLGAAAGGLVVGALGLGWFFADNAAGLIPGLAGLVYAPWAFVQSKRGSEPFFSRADVVWAYGAEGPVGIVLHAFTADGRGHTFTAKRRDVGSAHALMTAVAETYPQAFIGFRRGLQASFQHNPHKLPELAEKLGLARGLDSSESAPP